MNTATKALRHDIRRKLNILSNLPEGEAHPASVWVKFAAVPLLLGSVWSHTTIDLWCLVLIAAVVTLMLGVPLSLSKPDGNAGWAVRSALGENLFTLRKNLDIPESSVFVPKFLLSFATTTLIGGVLAAYLNQLWPTILLGTVSLAAKAWFQHTMAELFTDQMAMRPDLRVWLD